MFPKIEQTNEIEVFFSYAHKDERMKKQLEEHLSLLKRQRLIETWHDRDINAGQEWENEINKHLNEADIILLLVSSSFMASEYCYSIEMRRALERHNADNARVIPIILRVVDWKAAPFGKLQSLPKDGKPVTRWRDRDEAFADITNGIRKAVGEIQSNYNNNTEEKGDISDALQIPNSSSLPKEETLRVAHTIDNNELTLLLADLSRDATIKEQLKEQSSKHTDEILMRHILEEVLTKLYGQLEGLLLLIEKLMGYLFNR